MRKDQLILELQEKASDLSGFAPDELDPKTTFLRLGFDSLFLTQLAAAFQREWKVKITFRQLIETLPTIEALAEYLDAQLPAAPEAPKVPQEQAPAVPAVAQPSVTSTPMALPSATSAMPVNADMRSIFSQQLALMQRQIEMLTGTAAIATDPFPADVTPASSEGPSVTTPTADEMPKGFGPSLDAGAEALTPAQLNHIKNLTQRYNKKTAGSKERTQRDRQYHADPRTAAGFNPLWKEIVYPIVIEKSYGSHLWDVDGNKYVDLLNGFGPNFFGHRAPFITDAIKRQLDDGFEVGPQTPLAGEAAKLLCELTGMDRVSWVNTGSEAVQAAMRISRTVTGREKVVLFSGDYHGNFDEVLVRRVGQGERSKTMPLAPGIPQASVSNVVALDYGEEASLAAIEEMADEVACVLVEPIQSRRPEFQPKEFLHKLRKLTTDKGIVLVFDEVITGFRTEPGGAQAYFGIQADLATYGKIIGGGMPIGVVAGRSEFMDTFDGGFWQYGDDSKPTAGVTFFAGTFVRHPMTIAAVHATLSYLKSAGPALQQGVNAKAKRLADSLNTFFEERGVNIFVAQFASQMFIRVKEESELATLFFYHMRERGVHTLEGFPSYMTAAHTDEDVDFIINAAKSSIIEMQRDGVLCSPKHDPNVADDTAVPLTPAQQEIWATSQLGDSACAAYNESDTIIIRGKIDTAKLVRAVNDTLNAHPIFRARVDDQGTAWTPSPTRLEAALLESEDIASLIEEEGKKPFSLDDGILARATVVKVASEEHVIILYAHHIAFDGYSAALVFEEISARYDGREHDIVAPCFDQFVAEQADPSRRATSLAYWREELDGVDPEPLPLPVDRPFPDQREYRAGAHHGALSNELAGQIRKVARDAGVTPSSIYLSAFALLMSGLTGRQNVLVGVPQAGQATSGIDAVGCCVSMLPILVETNQSVDFLGLSSAVQSKIATATAHPETTLLELLPHLDVVRDPARPSLIQVVFNYSAMLSDLQIGDAVCTAKENPRQFLAYDLFANLSEQDGSLVADWEYASSAFDPSSISLWLEMYEGILKRVVAEPNFTLQTFSLLNERNLSAMQTALSGGAPVPTRHPTIIDAFEDMVSVQPDAIAISQRDVKLTYADVKSQADKVSVWLKEFGVTPGDFVGVMMERHPAVLPVLLGIWKAGAAYLPLDPQYPSARLADMVADAKPTLIVSDIASANTLEADAGRVAIWSPGVAGNVAVSSSMDHTTSPDDIAYILYTSGSTGRPKGVVNTHGPLMNFLTGLRAQSGLESPNRVLALTTLGFDISMIEVFYPLMVGAEIIMASDDDTIDGEAMAELISDTQPDLMQATPSTYRLLMDAGWEGASDLVALCGGEPLTPDVASYLLGKVASLWNFYGPTEASVYCTCTEITSADDIHIGEPMPGTFLYILDDRNRHCPPGVIGEVCIGGAGVCAGYFNRDEETAKRFIANPLATDGRRIYRTGDLGKATADGRITLLGRADDQVKLRGFRIELGDIEAALLRHSDVAAAAAAVDGNGAEAALVAYVQYADGKAPTASALRRFLRDVVPHYMIPQFFVEVQEMPLTPAGKVNRHALPALQKAAPASAPVPPRTEVETQIADIWRDMLGIETVSVNDNFFELGGQSLQAAQMVARLRKLSGKKIAPRAVIFETLAQLAKGAEAV